MAPPETPEERAEAIRAEQERDHDDRLWRRGLWERLARVGKWAAIAAGGLSLTQDFLKRIAGLIKELLG